MKNRRSRRFQLPLRAAPRLGKFHSEIGETFGRLTIAVRGCRRQRAGQFERGFTLPEMLITLVLIALSTGLISTSIYQIFIVSSDGNARLSVLNDLENIAIWIGRDTSEAQSWTVGVGTIYGTLTTSDPTVQYRYSYDAANTALVREHLVSGTPVNTLNIARRIANQGDITFSNTGTLLTISVTSTVGSTSESSTLNLGMRVK